MKKTFSHLNEAGAARMVNVGHKPVQRRRAMAEGKLVCAPATIRALKKNALPKGDVLTVAQIAGIQAAKRTAELIPLCHPLALNHVEVSFRVRRAAIEIVCTAETSASTGVEMEALTGVSVAALTLYDMCKAVDKTMRIEGIRVMKKIKEMKIGRSPSATARRRAFTPTAAGRRLKTALREFLGQEAIFEAVIVPDEVELISAALRKFADVQKCDMVVTTGGTGISARDVTPEATRAVLEKELPGFGEIMRMQSFAKVRTAILSRAVAGTRGTTLIVNLPGKPSAVRECLEILAPAIREGLAHLRGEDPHEKK